MGRKKIPHEVLVDRFRASFKRRSACLDWTGAVDRDGYGMVPTEILGETRAHRVAWVLVNGPVPTNLCVLHSCDNPPCGNVAHLFVGTDADNMHDRHRKGRYAVGNAHPSRTHPERLRRGENHPSAKLTAGQVSSIRAKFIDRYGEQTRLAREFGVSVAAIHTIVRNKNWKGT